MKKLISFFAGLAITAIALSQDTIPTPARKGFQDSSRLDTMSLSRWNRDTSANRDRRRNRDTSRMRNPADSSLGNNANNKWPDTAMNNTGSMNRQNLKNDSSRIKGNWDTASGKAMASDKSMNDTSSSSKKVMENKVIMINDRMMVIKKGDSTLLSDNIKLKSGAVVMPDGTVKYSNGKTAKLKNGQYLALEPAEIKKTSTTTKKAVSTTKKKTRG